ncbi:MopE-related protein [Patescibacteria group bacterium]
MTKGKKFLTKNVIETSRLLFSLVISLSITSLLTLGYYFVQTSSKVEVDEEVFDITLPETGEGMKYRVFVSSQKYSGNLGGIAGADQKCQSLVSNAGLCGEYKAWLSTSSTNAHDRILNVAYYTVDGASGESALKVGSNKVDLLDGLLQHAIYRKEDGHDYPFSPPGSPSNDMNGVWTGTTEEGIKSGSLATDFCNDWTSSGSENGMIGNAEYYWNFWTEFETKACSNSYYLYCFEVSKDGDCDGYSVQSGDCNDTDSSIFPGATEVCDDEDNDCDFQVDEGLTQSCGSEVGECRKGIQTCNAGSWGSCTGEITPTTEICDNKDNDCDGITDEELSRYSGTDTGECRKGIQNCSGGGWNVVQTEVEPVSESCDGRDNDCDGSTDELTKSCGTNTGICTNGTKKCVSGSWGNCSGVSAQQEVCDGLDNNCNGQTDEGCPCDSGATQSCGTDEGACNSGTQWCEGGTWGECRGVIGPKGEICDNKDNDCDGKVDEDLHKSCGSDVGMCEQGIQYCSSGSWGSCDEGVSPSDEECDIKDNDCDGTIDEGCSCMIGEERECVEENS